MRLAARVARGVRITISAVNVGSELLLDYALHTIEHAEAKLASTVRLLTSPERLLGGAMPLTKHEQEQGLKQCENCGQAYDPIARRWRCPWCGFKEHCCEGAPQ